MTYAVPDLSAAAAATERGLAPERSLVDQIEAGPADDPGPGGWSGGFANQAHWDPCRPREWRCWAQSGPTWSAHCGAEVAADDALGLCSRHRRALLEVAPPAPADAFSLAPEPALRAS
jgi:hypothetical protein